MTKEKEVNMLKGPLFGQIMKFTLPLMVSGLLQTVYNAADMVVVGKFIDDYALAAVGATAALYNFLVCLFIGFSAGVDVLCSRLHGMKDADGVKKTIDTAVISSFFIGASVTVIGVLVTRPVLTLMGTPEEHGVLDSAVTYLSIVFLGVSFTVMYNFFSSILRTEGDTRTPFLYLTLAGAVNVGLNLLFVAVFSMGVAGVAWATVISQFLAAGLTFLRLWRKTGLFSFRFRNAVFSWRHFGRIFTVGFLAGIQNAIFSIANAFLQAGVNSLGSVIMAGNTAAETVENFVWITSTAFQYATVTFVSKNIGAGQYERANRVTLLTCLLAFISGTVLGVGSYLCGTWLFALFIDGSGEALPYAIERARYTFPLYGLTAVMGVLPSAIRGLGHSLSPTVITVLGVCVLRITWFFTVFRLFPSLGVLFTIHPITWVVTDIALAVAYLLYYRRMTNRRTLRL